VPTELSPTVHAGRSPGKPAVVMAGGGASLTYEELDRRSDRLAGVLAARGFKCPRHIVVTDDMPRLPTGKLFRRRLRERLNPSASTAPS
jgi:acyl-CoA synthetase (AMP-forming)/AMP-acid ligase II